MKKIFFSLILSLFCLTALGADYDLKCQPTGLSRVVFLQRIHGTMYNVRVSWNNDLRKETRNGRLQILSSTDLFHWTIQKEFRFGSGYIGIVSQCNYVDYGLFVEDHYPMPKTVCFYYNVRIVFD